MSGKGKKFRPDDVHKVYKTAYNEEFPWDSMLPPIIVNYFNIMYKGAGCPLQFILASMLALVASLAGPMTGIECHPDSMVSSLNLFFLAVSAPGGGKSATFNQIISPAAEIFLKDTGQNLILENYTHAGMQNHQGQCKGFGLIASDEGIRVLSSIENKQQKNEGERQFLCKTWTGKGDYTVLREKERGYPATSTSIMLFVQPQPFLGELRNFECNDGLLDRFLILAAMPFWYMSAIIAENAKLLKAKFSGVVTKVFKLIYDHHKSKGATYKFTTEAQEYYDKVCDDFASEFNKRYESTDPLNTSRLQCSQEDMNLITSKDPMYIARLAACFHILIRSLVAVLREQEWVPSHQVSVAAVKSAHKFYTVCLRQKFIFWQAVNGTSLTTHEILPTVENTKDRVMRTAFKMKGPLVSPREIHKLLKGITAEETKRELESLSNQGIGKLERRGVNECRRDMYYKPSPSSLTEGDSCWEVCHFTHSVYVAKFNDFSTMSASDYKLLPRHPQYEDIPIIDTPPSASSTQESSQSTGSQLILSQGTYHDDITPPYGGVHDISHDSIDIPSPKKPKPKKGSYQKLPCSTQSNPNYSISSRQNENVEVDVSSDENISQSSNIFHSSMVETEKSPKGLPKSTINLSPIHHPENLGSKTTSNILNLEKSQDSHGTLLAAVGRNQDDDDYFPSFQERQNSQIPNEKENTLTSDTPPATYVANKNDYPSPYRNLPDTYFKAPKRRWQGVTGPAKKRSSLESQCVQKCGSLNKSTPIIHSVNKDAKNTSHSSITASNELEESFMEEPAQEVENINKPNECENLLAPVNDGSHMDQNIINELEQSFMENETESNECTNVEQNVASTVHDRDKLHISVSSPPMTSSQYKTRLRSVRSRQTASTQKKKTISKGKRIEDPVMSSRATSICKKVRNALKLSKK